MKVGIITMHKVLNLGSALQAFALQKYLLRQNIANEIIDYEFPPKEKLLTRINLQLRFILYQIRTGILFKKSDKRYFNDFYKNHFRLSKKRYNVANIKRTNEIYDIFLTGSDQVWNPNGTKDDTSFLLSFVDDDKPKISYAASFTINSLPKKYKSVYKHFLDRYKHISVRERSGVDIVRQLTGKQADIVLDPTLLLDKEEYRVISKKPRTYINEPYILVYILSYMYNPFPDINDIVRKVQEKMGGVNVVYIGCGHFSAYSSECITLSNFGPCEFLWLLDHASFVVTTSFHGTVFASLFHKPLISAVKSMSDIDGRMPSLLKSIGGENSIVEFNNKDLIVQDLAYYTCSEEKLNQEIEKSRKILLRYFK